MRERETKRREGDRERRTIKENSKDKKKYFKLLDSASTAKKIREWYRKNGR